MYDGARAGKPRDLCEHVGTIDRPNRVLETYRVTCESAAGWTSTSGDYGDYYSWHLDMARRVEELGPARVFLTSYEQLARDPASVVRQIAARVAALETTFLSKDWRLFNFSHKGVAFSFKINRAFSREEGPSRACERERERERERAPGVSQSSSRRRDSTEPLSLSLSFSLPLKRRHLVGSWGCG